MRKILIVCLATMLSFGTAQAQGITIEGTVNCAQWASARAAGSAFILEAYQKD